MKPLIPLSLTLAITACLAGSAWAAESKRTAEYILSTPATYENKEVTLDVAFVKPVRWKSPIPELAFFHAMTIDRIDKKPGGGILVVIPAEDAAKFVKKYGMDFDGRRDSDTLRGMFITAPSHGPKGPVWLVDTSGKAAELFKQRKIEILDDEGMEGPGPGPGGRRGHGRPPGGPQ